jgi:ribosomal protein S12 methylthiotransferase
MRAALPDLALRTTFIVGYPGETEAEFQALLDFVQQMRFDRVGTSKFLSRHRQRAAGDPVAPKSRKSVITG